VAVVNIKLYVFSFLIIFIDIFTLLPEPINSGQVVVGYVLNGSTLTPLYENFLWLRLIIIVGMVLCSLTAIGKMAGGFDGI
jgi:hypothetical protein